jgi:hypothetical protein
VKQKNRDCRQGGISLLKMRSSIPFVSRFDRLSPESDRLLATVVAGASAGHPGDCALGRGYARGKRRLEEIAAGRGLPIEHFSCDEDAGEPAQHEIAIYFVERHAPRRRDRPCDPCDAGQTHRNCLDQASDFSWRQVAEPDALAKLPVEKQRSLAEAAKRGENVSAISARKACGPEAPKTSDGTGKARSTPSRRKKADLAPTLDPRAWSMSTPQEREAFVKTVGRSEIEDALNAIESGCKLTRGLNSLNQAWKAATEPELRTFCRQYFDEMNRLGWHQKSCLSG